MRLLILALPLLALAACSHPGELSAVGAAVAPRPAYTYQAPPRGIHFGPPPSTVAAPQHWICSTYFANTPNPQTYCNAY